MTNQHHLAKYCQYVLNTGGNATIASLDDDYEPIGPMVRAGLIPIYAVENAAGKLELTVAGKALLTKEQADD